MDETRKTFPHLFPSASDAEGSSLVSQEYISSRGNRRIARNSQEQALQTHISDAREEAFPRGGNLLDFSPPPGLGGNQRLGYSLRHPDLLMESSTHQHPNPRENTTSTMDLMTKSRWFDEYTSRFHVGQPGPYHQRDEEVRTLQLLPTLDGVSQGTIPEFPRSVSAPPAGFPQSAIPEQWAPPSYLRPVHEKLGENAFDAFPPKTSTPSSVFRADASDKKSRYRSKELRYTSSVVERTPGSAEEGNDDMMELEENEEQDGEDEGEEGDEEEFDPHSETFKRKSRRDREASEKNSNMNQTSGGNKRSMMSPHLLTERRRREKLNAQFLALRGVVPNITKMNKLSTLEDAILYIKSLKEKVSELEGQIKSNRCHEVENVDKTTTMKSGYDSNGSSQKCTSPEPHTQSSETPMEIEVSSVGNEGHIMTRIVCGRNRKALLADIGAAMEVSNLEVQQLSLMKSSESYYINIIGSRAGSSAAAQEENLEKALNDLLSSPLKAVAGLTSGSRAPPYK